VRIIRPAIPRTTIAVHATCPHCPWPVRLTISVHGAGSEITIDREQVRLAMTAHMRQHEG
jgi:hypothetical protein